VFQIYEWIKEIPEGEEMHKIFKVKIEVKILISWFAVYIQIGIDGIRQVVWNV